MVLPAPFGPIRAWMVPRANAQIDAVHRDEAGELLGQILGFEDEIVTHDPMPGSRETCRAGIDSMLGGT